MYRIHARRGINSTLVFLLEFWNILCYQFCSVARFDLMNINALSFTLQLLIQANGSMSK